MLFRSARTQQEDDPDLVLSAPFPITKASYRRKFVRDITGRTGFEQRKAQFLNALGDPSWPLSKRATHFRDKPRFSARARNATGVRSGQPFIVASRRILVTTIDHGMSPVRYIS